MIYEKRNDLIELKKSANLTYRDFAERLRVSPSAVAQKCLGFMALTLEEEEAIKDVCNAAINIMNQIPNRPAVK